MPLNHRNPQAHSRLCLTRTLLLYKVASTVTKAVPLLQLIHSKQSVFFVWELTWTQEPPPPLHGQFSVGFSPASEEQLTISLKPYTYEFQVENFFVCSIIAKWGMGRKPGALHGLDIAEVLVGSFSTGVTAQERL